jgi:hypothetical protein
MSDDVQRWVAWWRPGRKHRWQQVAQAATFAEAWAQLFRAKAGGDSLVLPAGEHPYEERHDA